MGVQIPHEKRQFLGKGSPMVSCAETVESIDWPFGLWTRLGRRKHRLNRIPQVAPMCPHGRAHKTPPGEYDWTVRLRRRCGLMSSYFDHLFNVITTCDIKCLLLRGKLFTLVRSQKAIITNWNWGNFRSLKRIPPKKGFLNETMRHYRRTFRNPRISSCVAALNCWWKFCRLTSLYHCRLACGGPGQCSAWRVRIIDKRGYERWTNKVWDILIDTGAVKITIYQIMHYLPAYVMHNS